MIGRPTPPATPRSHPPGAYRVRIWHRARRTEDTVRVMARTHAEARRKAVPRRDTPEWIVLSSEREATNAGPALA